MVRSSKVKILFLPYQPEGSVQPGKNLQDTDQSESKISWQRHASREYHRRRAFEKGSTQAVSLTRRKSGYQLKRGQHTVSTSQIDAPYDTTEDDFQEFFENSEKSLPIGDVVCSQLDPFGVVIPAGLPKHALNMFHHSYSTVWNIANFGTGKNGNMTHTVLLSSMTSPATFFSNVFAATAHLSWLRATKTNGSRQDELIQIKAKGLALSHMRREIASIEGFVTDELIFAMLVMAAYSKGDSIDYSQRETRSVGPRAFSYDGGYYGTVDFEVAHISSVVTLLQARGGLHTIKLPGLKEVIILADILCASKWICAPSLSLFRPTEETMSELPRYSIGIDDGLKYLPAGFRQLPLILASRPIVTIIGHMRITVLSYEDYMSQSYLAPWLDSLRFAAMTCTYNLHALDAELSSSMVDGNKAKFEADQSDTNMLESALYSALRYACIAFANQFLWPLPRSSGIQLKLSLLLDYCLQDLRQAGGWNRYPELTLWVALMGALVGIGSIRSDFIQTCRTCLDFVGPLVDDRYRKRSSHANVQYQIKPESGPYFYTRPNTDPLELWESMLQICRTFLLYEGTESSLGVNLGQVRDEWLDSVVQTDSES